MQNGVSSNFKGKSTVASIAFSRADIPVTGCFNEMIQHYISHI